MYFKLLKYVRGIKLSIENEKNITLCIHYYTVLVRGSFFYLFNSQHLTCIIVTSAKEEK